MGIPFPEQLDDDTWTMKLAQITWLAEKGILGAKFNNINNNEQ